MRVIKTSHFKALQIIYAYILSWGLEIAFLSQIALCIYVTQKESMGTSKQLTPINLNCLSRYCLC